MYFHSVAEKIGSSQPWNIFQQTNHTLKNWMGSLGKTSHFQGRGISLAIEFSIATFNDTEKKYKKYKILLEVKSEQIIFRYK